MAETVDKGKILDELVANLPGDRQSAPQRVLSTIWELWIEVHCDGFGFYFVYEAESVPVIVCSLEEIGAHRASGICKRAINVAFPNGIPETADKFPKDPDEFPAEVFDKLDPLDREFFEHPDDIIELLFAYVEKHPENFSRCRN